MPRKKKSKPVSTTTKLTENFPVNNQSLAYLKSIFSSPILGQLLLPKPNIQKTTKVASNEHLTVCISSMQGWRVTMEDSCCLFLEIPNDNTHTSLIGIFDGHGGVSVSDYVARNLYKFVLKQPEYLLNTKKAIIRGFIEIDAKMKKERPEDQSGTTAITIFLRNNVLYCGNLGDSRAISYENGKITPLSYDHKPTLPLEFKRIIEAGGWVDAERVNGTLALSRALGDFQFKTAYHLRPEQQIVSCVPDVIMKKIDPNWKFVLLACDGIWEVMNNQKVGEFVKNRLDEGMPIDKVCESLMMHCLAPRTDGNGLGCDNMTVGLILFKWPN